MATVNGEIKVTEVETPGTWGDKEIGEYGTNSDQHRGTRQASSEAGSESLALDRDDRSWGNSSGQRGQAVVGGIFTRLITKTRNQIEESESRTADLKQELEELETLFNQFQQQTEDPEGLKPES